MTPASLTATTLDEETARAEVYGLLAALYYAAPSAERRSRSKSAGVRWRDVTTESRTPGRSRFSSSCMIDA